MSKPLSPTPLPAVSRGSAATSGSVEAAAVPTSPAVDYVAVYRQYCAEEGCKANSAFVRYIQDRGGHFSLERLNLGHNYLGSKGLRPVLRMIDLSQTIVAINLEDNGIGNDAVDELCAVLERHVSIASLNLRRNPISVVGGKRLLLLAERNPRMMDIAMEGTDIFEGLQERIRMALQHNAAVAQGSGPQMEAQRAGSPPPPSSSSSVAQAKAKGAAPSRPARAATANTQPSRPPPKASLQPLPAVSASAPATATLANASIINSNGSFTSRAQTPSSPLPTSQYRPGWQEASLSRTQPRPPPPAVASHTSKALPLHRVIDVKALFAERARLHTEVNRGEASKRAYTVREELQALQRHGRPVPDDEADGAAAAAAAVPSSGAAVASANIIPLLPNLASDARRGGEGSEASSEQRETWRRASSGQRSSNAADSLPASPPTHTRAGSSVERTTGGHPQRLRPNSGSLREANGSANVGPLAVTPPQPPPLLPPVQAPNSLSSPARPLAHTVEDVLSPSRMMLLTTEEQFTVLFDQGCREYVNRNLDAAYMAWNEAMRLAVAEGQREWMAVVASNLQRLSYELLVEEGATHLERGALEKAGETFHLALEVAVKAKNAVWERDMRLAKQNVQKALFHRCHEAALLLFSRAQEEAQRSHDDGDGEDGSGGAAEVTEDDYFVLPGTEEMVRHTPAFVRQWACLLLLKEAVGLWVEATRVVARLSEVAAAPLRENIAEALNLVASFIVQRKMNDAAPTGLLWFGADAYLYPECVLLSELWYDLVADSEQSLHHPLLSAVCASQLGELYVATFQLPQALVQLEKLVKYGKQHRVPVLEATGLTLCGRVHLQRANHALAEVALEAALELWSAVQRDPVVWRLTHGGEGSGGGGGAGGGGIYTQETAPMDTAAVTAEMLTAAPPADPSNAAAAATANSAADANNGGAHFRIEAHLPPDAITVLATACRHYKVCLLLQTYRYRDALETLEYGLNVAYHDTLQSKLERNYPLNPSLDQIAAIAGVLRTSLVFYALTSRYDWSATLKAYQAEESLCMWVLAESREMRFVEVNLTSNFKCTMQDLLDSLRQRLCVEPEMALQPDIITELPSRSWQEPLRVLYQACIHPIIGYVRAADPQLLFGDGVITVVPTGLLWLVPYHALLNVKAGDRYLVEEAAVQLAFSATQAAFAALSAARVQQRDVHREVVAVQTDTERGVADVPFYSAFPSNADRSTGEGEVVAAMLRAGQAQVAERQLKRAAAVAATSLAAARETTTVFTHKVEVVETVEALRAVLPRARTLHIATATTSAPPSQRETRQGRPRAEEEGGLLLSTASSMGEVGIIRAAEIAHTELFAEHVILTNTNMSRAHVRGIRDDVLGLVRSFFGGGVPCVIAGQWCTPDMEPMELFQRFYSLWCRPPSTSSEASLRTLTQPASGPQVSESGTSVSNSEAATAAGDGEGTPTRARALQHTINGGSYDGMDGMGEDEAGVVRHRALLLARSIRRLLAEEPATRYRPRVWAGYYSMGTGW